MRYLLSEDLAVGELDGALAKPERASSTVAGEVDVSGNRRMAHEKPHGGLIAERDGGHARWKRGRDLAYLCLGRGEPRSCRVAQADKAAGSCRGTRCPLDGYPLQTCGGRKPQRDLVEQADLAATFKPRRCVQRGGGEGAETMSVAAEIESRLRISASTARDSLRAMAGGDPGCIRPHSPQRPRRRLRYRNEAPESPGKGRRARHGSARCSSDAPEPAP